MAYLDEVVDLHRTGLHRREPGAVLRCERGRGPGDGVPRQMIETLDGVDPGADLVVIAANDDRARDRSHALDHRVGIGTVADQIAQHEHASDVAGCGERGLERFEVGVNVADDQVTHQYSIQANTRSTTSGTGPVASTRTCA